MKTTKDDRDQIHKRGSVRELNLLDDLDTLESRIRTLEAALKEMIFAGRGAYDNGYPEMEAAVVRAREALEAKGKSDE